MRRALLVASFALGALVAIPGVALAHAGFVSSTPEPGATLGTPPGVVRVGFSEPLNQTLSRATVTAPDGAQFQGRPTGPAQIVVTMTTNAQGLYEVDWTTVSLVDGHTLHGSFRFGVGVTVTGDVGGTATNPRSGDLVIAAARVIEDLALLLAVGFLLIGWLSRRPPPLDRIRAHTSKALGVAFVAGFLVVVGEALAAAPTASIGAVASYLTTGLPGVARLARPAIELAALVVAVTQPKWTWIPLSLALIALSAAGHAAAIRPSWWGVTVETVHLVSTGIWAGGILALAIQRPSGGWLGDEGLALLGRFTPVALGAFAISALTGILRATQELGSLRALAASAYGNVLVVKVLLVAFMVQLSLLAWRRLLVKPRIEAGVAVLAVLAAALLSAFPLPPARLVESDTFAAAISADSALPKPGDLTLGGDAGTFLVGLTLRQSTQQVLVFLRGPEGDPATAGRVVGIALNGRALPVDECGPTCRTAGADTHEGDVVDVSIQGDGGGDARFRLPVPSPPDAGDELTRALATMHSLHSYRQDEELTAGGPVVLSSYAFVAPNSFEAHTREPGGGADTVWIGDTRYLRELPGKSWQIEHGVGAPSVPTFVWDSFAPFIDARMIDQAKVKGVPTDIVASFGGDASLPVWFRLWIDAKGLVRKAEMRAEGHFMDHRYYAFDAPIAIEPPKGASG